MDDVPDEPDLMSDTDSDSCSETDSGESESGGEVILQASDSDSFNEDAAASHARSILSGDAWASAGTSSEAAGASVDEQVTPEEAPVPALEVILERLEAPRAEATIDHEAELETEPIREADAASDAHTPRSFRSQHSDDSGSEREAVLRKPHERRRRRIKNKTIADHKTAGRYFQAGDYASAEALYTKAITADPTAPLLYTNRAMARIKLNRFDEVVSDCDESLKLLPYNMKAWYYKAQALLAINSAEEALAAGRQAYTFAANSGDRSWERSLGNIVALVLKCKKAVWEQREKQRQRDQDPLQEEVLQMMEKERQKELSRISEGEQQAATELWDRKLEDMKRVFANARGETVKREVPDWMVDDITFAIMVDPVITKTGNSYERASIMEHLRRSHTDPLTRSPLEPEELRPNLALREACEQFLEENGWAVDY